MLNIIQCIDNNILQVFDKAFAALNKMSYNVLRKLQIL